MARRRAYAIFSALCTSTWLCTTAADTVYSNGTEVNIFPPCSVDNSQAAFGSSSPLSTALTYEIYGDGNQVNIFGDGNQVNVFVYGSTNTIEATEAPNWRGHRSLLQLRRHQLLR
ncbi:hypothetical protein KC317_g1653 [Hortaea werneckii]|nr:hypothetical protein KC352_g15544 [Hortaea werneckii]KAI7571406.1 hypothetical protein KC317_g1653 [Hortaea werneckii]KAI7625499.1 hypothetical protein KC346_g1692 [Hortaea werneckii]KAI7721093.1 hypothetical protein KC322_g1683 [Hortaea werneckii]